MITAYELQTLEIENWNIKNTSVSLKWSTRAAKPVNWKIQFCFE